MPTGAAPATHVVELFVEADWPRQREPVTCGIPWPRAALTDPSHLVMSDEANQTVPLQTKVLDRWSDGSVRWLLLDWQASVMGQATYRVQVSASPVAPASGLHIDEQDGIIMVATGAAEFRLLEGGHFPFDAITRGDREGPSTCFRVEDEAGRVFQPRIDQVILEERGPLRASVLLAGRLVHPCVESLARLQARLHFFAGSATVRCELTIHNPRRARHPGGRWGLGQRGSIFIKDAALSVTLPPGNGPITLACSPEPGQPLAPIEAPFELYQDSSGGDNWRSHNHVNRYRVVPISFRGYRLRARSGERSGLRATPIVTLTHGDASVAFAMRHFWQNFPKAVEVADNTLIVRLFPGQYADSHELQGGEQKTHTFQVAFGSDAVTAEPLGWTRSPLRARAAPAWYAASGAIAHLTPRADDPNADYLALVHAAISGSDTFEHKRAIVDEYGWRHFGDIYADHETVYHKGATPLVSHYNNQYDPLAGFACQFLRSGDPRWWSLMDELAGHVIDIDIYRTDHDKTAYNHGLFWHTVHHVDADTSTHRSYPRSGKIYGGGPGSEHNYTTGLMLHHFLTGALASCWAAIDLAHWVLDMDDGSKTVFRWLDRGDTGLASATVSPDYHGPGRGAGNSINALLDGYRLTGAPALRAKIEQLIRRCIHPADDIAARNLLDAERRWSYTIFLQALGKFLDDCVERDRLDGLYAYARAALLHYVRWMAEHEYPILDKPERVQYPTETWAAQDLRKVEVFQFAAKHASGPEHDRFLERARYFFQRSIAKLTEIKTSCFARPLAILLNHGYARAFFERKPPTAPPPRETPADFGNPAKFVPQKIRAKRRFLYLAAAAVAALVGVALIFWPR